MKDKCLPLLRNFTTELLLNATPFRYRPSPSSMHCRTWSVPLYITRTWKVMWHFFQERFLFSDYASLSNVSENTSNCPPQKEIKKPTDRAKRGGPRNFAIGRMHSGQPTSDPCMSSTTFLAESRVNLIFMLSTACPSTTEIETMMK